MTFSDQRPAAEQVEEISKRLEMMLSLPSHYQPPTRWEAFEPYTTRAMTARLAQAFDKALLKSALPQNL